MPDPAATPSAANAATPPPAQRSPMDPVEIKTRVELVRMAFHELTIGTVPSIVASVLFGVTIATKTEADIAAYGWMGFVLLVCAARLWLAWAFRRAKLDAEQMQRWAFAFVALTTITAFAWGLTACLFPGIHRGGTLSSLHVLLLAGLAAGSGRMLLPMRKGSVAYIVTILAPLALRYMADGDVIGIISGIAIIGLIVFMASATLRNNRVLSDALVARFEREAIATELAQKNVEHEAREVELREARVKAETASTAKGEFLAVISHEIRTPMNGVLGMLRIVRDTELTSEQRGYLKTASDSAEALLLLLNDVLDFSKIEAGRLELEAAPFPPGAMAKGVVDLLHARARDKGLALELTLGDNLPGVIISDSARLRQILVNLIGNAIKFTDRGKVELSVICAERTPTKAMMHFTVTDTGIGIDSAAQERLFKPFTQADSSMSRKYGGTGLGLAISQRIAQSMGGALQVSSVLNKGSTFRVIVPCALPEITETVTRITEAPKFVTPNLRGRVLVVEDDSVNQQVIDLFLKKMGLTPKFAPDGEMAITTATSEAFDIVLMDCQLPGIDGMEATRRIRQKLDGKPLTIVALTANASTTVRDNCLAAGMNDFLSKPVRFELLAGLLQKHLPSA